MVQRGCVRVCGLHFHYCVDGLPIALRIRPCEQMVSGACARAATDATAEKQERNDIAVKCVAMTVRYGEHNINVLQ